MSMSADWIKHGAASLAAFALCAANVLAAGPPPADEEIDPPPPEIVRYVAAAAEAAERVLNAAIAEFEKAPSGTEKRLARIKIRELLAQDSLPRPVLDVRRPEVGAVGVLGEPHQVLEVRDREVLVLRDTYRRRFSRPEEVHFFLLGEIETSDLAEGAVAEFPQIWLLTETYAGARADGRDTFLARPIDDLVVEHQRLLDEALEQLRERYRRWR